MEEGTWMSPQSNKYEEIDFQCKVIDVAMPVSALPTEKHEMQVDLAKLRKVTR